jgi:hypothetical protein
MNSKNEIIRHLCRGINKFKRGSQPRNNLLMDENGDLLADFCNILNSWRNYYSQLLNIRVDDKQKEIYIAELAVPNPSPLEV